MYALEACMHEHNIYSMYFTNNTTGPVRIIYNTERNIEQKKYTNKKYNYNNRALIYRGLNNNGRSVQTQMISMFYPRKL